VAPINSSSRMQYRSCKINLFFSRTGLIVFFVRHRSPCFVFHLVLAMTECLHDMCAPTCRDGRSVGSNIRKGLNKNNFLIIESTRQCVVLGATSKPMVPSVATESPLTTNGGVPCCVFGCCVSDAVQKPSEAVVMVTASCNEKRKERAYVELAPTILRGTLRSFLY